MKNYKNMNENTFYELISEYEAMSQQGTVGFYEETVYLDLANYYEETKKLEEALKVIDHALIQYSYSAGLYIRKAQILLECKRSQAALDCLDQAAIFAPSEKDIFFLRADALCALGYTEDALYLLNELKPKTMSPKDLSEIYLFEALTYENMEQFDKMFEALESALYTDPKNNEAMERVWFSVELSNKHIESVKLHKYLLDVDAYNYIAWYNLGHAYTCLEKYEEAAQAFEYAFLANNDFEFAYRDCAESFIALGRYDEALSHLNEAAELFKPDAHLLMRIGYCYQGLKNFEMAQAYYIKSTTMKKKNSDAFFHLGECFSLQHQWNSAIAAFKRAISIDARKEEYYAGLGEVYYSMSNIDMAKIYFSKAVDTAPETAKYWIQFASFLLETENYDEAMEVIDDGIINAGGTELPYCKIACYFFMNNRKEALTLLNDALIENFEQHDSLYVLIPALEHDNDVQAMIATYRPN